jgi:hypothetical protein
VASLLSTRWMASAMVSASGSRQAATHPSSRPMGGACQALHEFYPQPFEAISEASAQSLKPIESRVPCLEHFVARRSVKGKLLVLGAPS